MKTLEEESETILIAINTPLSVITVLFYSSPILLGFSRYFNRKTEKDTKVENIDRLLAEYDNKKRTYDFNGVLISKNKLKRNLSQTQVPLTSSNLIKKAIDNSTLTDEELLQIEKCILKKTSLKQKIKEN